MYRIGEAAKMLGLTPRTIRHYEDVGLIRPGHVGENKYRYYSEAEVVLLDGIAALARLGVPLTAIRDLLKGMEQEGLDEVQRVRRLLARQLAAVEEELKGLHDIREVIRQADFALELNRDKPLTLVKSVAMTLAVNRAALARWEDRWSFDEQAARYDEVTGRYTEGYNPHENYNQVLEFVAEMFARDAKVLDIGIGTGNLAQQLLKQGCDVLGIDQSREMLRIAREKLPQVSLLEANMLALPMANESVQGVASTYVLHHLEDQDKKLALQEMFRVLKPGGLLVLGDNMFFDTQSREDARRRLEEQGRGEDWEAVEDEHLANVTFLAGELEALGLGVGFKQMATYTWVVWGSKR